MLIGHDVLTKCLQKKDWFRNLTPVKSSTGTIIGKAYGKPVRNKVNHRQSRDFYRPIPFKSKIKAIAVFHAKWRLSEERPQKFHTDDVWLPRPGWCFWLVEANIPHDTTNQKHYPDLGNDASSVWNFCACFSDVISWGNQRWHREPIKSNKEKIEHDQNRYDTKLACLNTWIQVWDILKSGPLA